MFEKPKAIDGSEKTDELSDDSLEGVTKRHRWGTTRNKHGRPKKENVSRSKTLKRILHPHGDKSSSTEGDKDHPHHHRLLKTRIKSIRKPNTHSIHFPESHRNESDSDDNIDPEASDAKNRKNEKRTIVFNRPLPEDMIDPETGHPIIEYPRNKIRTTKYTPLSFCPKIYSINFSTILPTFISLC